MKKEKVILSLIYKFVERIIVKGLGLVISIILARLLAPEQFGLIAIILVFIDLSQTFVQGGLNSSLVQNKDTNIDDYSTVFFTSTAIAVFLIMVLWLAAPFIDSYYNCIGLVKPLRFFSLALIFSAFNSIQVAKMQREMKFRQMLFCSMIATVTSGAIGIASAYAGLGLWALILYYFSNTVISCISMLTVSGWRPKPVYSFERAKMFYSYGWKMLVSAILCSLYNNLRSLIIGKIFSQEELGYYNRGQQFPDIVGNTLDVSIQSVMFPVLSNVQDRKNEVLKLLKKTIAFGAFIIMPAMLGLAAIAEPLIELLLTEKWLPCVVYMQIICIGNMTIPLTSSNLVAIKAIGRSDLYMKLELIRRIAMLLVLAFSVVFFHSVKAIAIGYAVSAWIDFFIISIVMKRIINYGFIDQLKEIWKTLFSTVAMFTTCIFIVEMRIHSFWIMVVQIIIGVAVYVIINLILRNESQTYLLRMCRKMLIKNKQRKA